jgi:hypothetical protein
MYICVDFDGTIVDHQYPAIGPPVPHAIEWLLRWQELGAKIILFTMRDNGDLMGDVLTQAVEYLADKGVKLHGVNHNPNQSSWTTSPKAHGHIYIDDSAYGCPLIQPEGFVRDCADWSVIGPDVEVTLTKK